MTENNSNTKYNYLTDNNKPFDVFIVGGYVRDKLLGLEPNDVDYLVVTKDEYNVNDTIEYLLSLDFKQVGNDFPVFLDPISGDEWALARTERKVGVGYNGFETQVENVSIYDDLLRRDLTINSLAFNEETQEYVEPLSGTSLEDIKNKVLRPTSEAFVEDPLRFIRLARMSSKLPSFEIETRDFTKLLNNDIKNEIFSLSKERLFAELSKNFETQKPSNFFGVLNDLDLLDIYFKIDLNDTSLSESIALLDFSYSMNKDKDFNITLFFLGLLAHNEKINELLYNSESKSETYTNILDFIDEMFLTFSLPNKLSNLLAKSFFFLNSFSTFNELELEEKIELLSFKSLKHKEELETILNIINTFMSFKNSQLEIPLNEEERNEYFSSDTILKYFEVLDDNKSFYTLSKDIIENQLSPNGKLDMKLKDEYILNRKLELFKNLDLE